MEFTEKVEKQYLKSEGEQYHRTIHGIPENAFPWIAKLRVKKIRSFVKKEDVVLEYGVGIGWNIAELQCKKRVGYDLSAHLREPLEKRGIEFISDLDAFPDEHFDVVLCHHVLEHTGNPPQTLLDIQRKLRRSGRLLLFVPFERGRKYHHYEPREPNHHLYSWNVQTLGNLIEKTGFEVVSGTVLPFGYDRFSAVWATRLHMGEFGFKFIRKMLLLLKSESEVFILARKEQDSAHQPG